MTDAVLPTVRTVTEALTPERLSKRYAAERRFRVYGVVAILIALSMLVWLLSTIVYKGYPAFFQAYVGLDVYFDPAEIDATGRVDADALRGANFTALARNALREQFPGVTGRTNKRRLNGLLSSGVDIELRNAVIANPGLIGQVERVWVKTSDDADVFVKGQVTDIARTEPTGIATPIGTSGDVVISVGANAFREILAQIKAQLGDIAARLEDELDGLERSTSRAERVLTDLRADLASADGDRRVRIEQEIADAESTIASNAQQIAELQARVDDLRQRAENPGGTERLSPDLSSFLVRINGGLVKLTEVGNAQASGQAIIPLESEASAQSGDWQIVTYLLPESDRRLTDREVSWLQALDERGALETRFNATFFTAGDSREPEQAGIWGAVVGSFLTLVTSLIISFPIGVLAAVYLEEFAPKNRWTDLIEVNINNLAAVPSIVFGLLGLAMFLNFFGMPRSAPLVGGMVLALMTLPTIIIASRAALKAVPPSIREAALGVGASKLQVMTHHVLPLAMPGILTGTIIGMAQALGESAPLLMIGMVAFIVDVPGGFTDPATVLPVQVYIWADSPERAFEAKTSAAIMVLLGFLIFMNALAVLLRKQFERRW